MRKALAGLSDEAINVALDLIARVKIHAEHTDCNRETKRIRYEYGEDANGNMTRKPVSSYGTGIYEQNRNCELADYQDDRLHCKHGTFIGTWDGPDYLCGLCESDEYPHGHMWLYALALNAASDHDYYAQRERNRERLEELKLLRAASTDRAEKEALTDQMIEIISAC